MAESVWPDWNLNLRGGHYEPIAEIKLILKVTFKFKGGHYQPIAEIKLILKVIFKFKGGHYQPIAEIKLILKLIFKIKIITFSLTFSGSSALWTLKY